MVAILNYPNSRLHQKAEYVQEVNTPEIQSIIDEMIKTLYATPNAAAFAATQLDFPNPKRITVIDLSHNKNELLVLVNPEILSREGSDTEAEGCMSVYPDYIHEKVTRAFKIEVKALDRTGKPLQFTAEGYLARCIQHEVDHLEGKLYIQHLSAVKLDRVRKKVEQVIRHLKNKQ